MRLLGGVRKPSSLVGTHTAGDLVEDDTDDIQEQQVEAGPPSLWAELIDICWIAAPTALGNMLEYLPVCTAMGVVGRLPGDEAEFGLATMSLGRAYFNITAMAPVFGMVGALRTLCPQAVGAGQPHLISIYIQQTATVIMLAAIPCIGLQFCASTILTALGEPREVAELAHRYCIRLIPQFFGIGAMVTLQRVYQAHKMVWSNLAICAIGFAIAPPLQLLLVNRAGLGVMGAAWANSISQCSYVLFQTAHLTSVGMGSLFHLRLKEAWSVQQMKSFLSLSLPAFFQVLFKWCATETVVFASGMLRPPERPLAVSSMATNLLGTMLMAWIGILVGLSVNVGRYVGAGKLRAAQIAAHAGVMAAALMGTAAAMLLLFYREGIVALFTNNDDLQALGCSVLPIVAMIVMADALNNAAGGVLSGLGMQRAIALCQLFGYYVLGIPGGLALAFLWFHGREEGVFGLWIGSLVAMVVSLLLQSTVLVFHRWELSAAQARSRLGSSAWSPGDDEEDDPQLAEMRPLRMTCGTTSTSLASIPEFCPGAEGDEEYLD